MNAETLLTSISFWHWLVLAVVLFGLEIFAPGVVFMWLGLAAIVVGGVLYFVPGLEWEYQLLLFSLLSVFSIILWRRYQKSHPLLTDQPSLNRRGEQYVGRIFTLDEAMVNNMGKIRVDDTTWKVEGCDCPAGTRVRVVGVDGVILKVEVVQA